MILLFFFFRLSVLPAPFSLPRGRFFSAPCGHSIQTVVPESRLFFDFSFSPVVLLPPLRHRSPILFQSSSRDLGWDVNFFSCLFVPFTFATLSLYILSTPMTTPVFPSRAKRVFRQDAGLVLCALCFWRPLRFHARFVAATLSFHLGREIQRARRGVSFSFLPPPSPSPISSAAHRFDDVFSSGEPRSQVRDKMAVLRSFLLFACFCGGHSLSSENTELRDA